MPESQEGDYRPISEIRARVEEDVKQKFPWMDGRTKDLQIEVETFEQIDSNEITSERATQLLETDEKYWREKANQDLAKLGENKISDVSFNIWSRLQDALKSAKGDVSPQYAIDYFRNRAAECRLTAQGIENIMNGKEPLLTKEDEKDVPQLFQRVFNMSQNLPTRYKAAENYDTAARIFENKLNLEEAEISNH
jgi:hypothetical protein